MRTLCTQGYACLCHGLISNQVGRGPASTLEILGYVILVLGVLGYVYLVYLV